LLTGAARTHDLGARVHKPLKARKEYGGNFGNRLLPNREHDYLQCPLQELEVPPPPGDQEAPG
jgi:hypothetical protein